MTMLAKFGNAQIGIGLAVIVHLTRDERLAMPVLKIRIKIMISFSQVHQNKMRKQMFHKLPGILIPSFNHSERTIMNKINAAILMAAAGFAFSCSANATDAKSTFNAAKDTAKTTYTTAIVHCDTMAGQDKKVCISEAKAVKVRTVADAEVAYQNTPKVRSSAITDIAKADYDVALTKCDSQAGNDKKVCVKEAKAAKIGQIADAKANLKISAVRADAMEDTRDANYKAEVQQCQALAGPTKDSCISTAKNKYHQ